MAGILSRVKAEPKKVKSAYEVSSKIGLTFVLKSWYPTINQINFALKQFNSVKIKGNTFI